MYSTLSDRIPKNKLTDKNIILDLDETLVYSHAEITEFEKLGVFKNSNINMIRDRLYTIKFKDGDVVWGVTRPHLEEFLVFCFSYFKKVIVWSAGIEEYVKKVCKFIFKDLPQPDLILTKNDCIQVGGIAKIKPLKKIIKSESWLGLTMDNTYFIDDQSYTFSENQSNAIHIPGFHPSSEKEILNGSDDTLLMLMGFFTKNRYSNDVRKTDKTMFM